MDHRLRIPVACSVTLLAAVASAQGLHLDVGEDGPRPSWIVLPYAFASETLQTAFGIAGGGSGNVQESSRFFAAWLESTNDSRALYLLASQVRLADRWFADGNFSVGRYGDLRIYSDPEGFPSSPPAGSNGSAPDARLQAAGTDSWLDFRFR